MLNTVIEKSAPPAQVAKEVKASKLGRYVLKVLLHTLLIIGSLLMIAPFVWMVLTALKPDKDIYTWPPTILPSEWRFDNFGGAMEQAPFGMYFMNSLIMACSQVAVNVGLASMAGYAFARYTFRGSRPLFWLILAKMMIPTQVTLIPVFILMKNFPLAGDNNFLGQNGTGLINTYLGLILPGAVTAFGIFIFRQFFMTLPTELEDAARIDGCSEFRIYWNIMLPLCKPAAVTLALFTFEASWNAYIWPLVITQGEQLRTIQLGLTVFRGENQTMWAYLMAGTTLATLPVILVFMFSQRYFIKGISTSGLTG
jgi:multiple sugar transport system permease protein